MCTWRFGARSERQHIRLSGRKHRRGRERQGHASGQTQPQDVLGGVRLHRQGSAAYITWNRQTAFQSLMVEPGAKGLAALEKRKKKREGKQTIRMTESVVLGEKRKKKNLSKSINTSDMKDVIYNKPRNVNPPHSCGHVTSN